jgi:RNA polymerase sigma factor (sigma-70 family)
MTNAQASLVLQHIRRLAGMPRAAQPPDAQLLQRFTAQRDEAAFATLVQRHGPMVLNVCRSVLRHEQDAEDAFQATFLALSRQAASLRQPEAVAGWLYEVAYRVAVKAQAEAARRRAQERKVSPMAPPDPTLDMTVRDLHRVLHEELRRLPEKYRLPLVLCYLEGRSHEEAACQLGWSKGTLRGRLDRGREQLRRRLAARGVTLSALLGTTTIIPRATAKALVDSVVRAAVLCAVDAATVGVLSARASALAEGVIRTMFLDKIKVVTAILLAVGLAAGVGALARPTPTARERPVGNPQSEVRSQPPQPVAAKSAADDKESIAYSGRILGPDGRPVAGAKLQMTVARGYPLSPSPSPEYATAGPDDGRFEFRVPKATAGDQVTVVTATLANHGARWVEIPAGGKRDDLTLQLVDDDVPITGQIVDLEGKPVAGATLRVRQIKAAPKEDLGPWLAAAESKKGLSDGLERQHFKRSTRAVSPQVTTDAEGRFRLTGIGRNRLVIASVEGPTIASQYLRILTRPGETIQVLKTLRQPEYGQPRLVRTYYGAVFRHVAEPTKPIVGVVRDKDTQKPLVGVTIQGYNMDIVRTTTDIQGRYRLVGMPKGEGNRIVVVPPRDLPYVAVHTEVHDSPGLSPVTVDFQLQRGVWIEGKITDKVTGKPLPGNVEYWANFSANPNLRDYEGFDGALVNISTAKDDGSYRVVGLPGPGIVAVYSMNDYLRAPERDDEDGIKETSELAPYHIMVPGNYSALVRINPAKGVDALKRDVRLDPGWTFTCTVLGLDGKPLVGARSFGLTGMPMWGMDRWEPEGGKTAAFTVRGFNPHRPRDLLFVHPEKGLAGVA